MTPRELKEALEKILESPEQSELRRSVAQRMLEMLQELEDQINQINDKCMAYEKAGNFEASKIVSTTAMLHVQAAVGAMLRIGSVIWPAFIKDFVEEEAK